MTNKTEALDPFSHALSSDYPLRVDELRFLAAGWWDEFFDVVSRCVLYGHIGRTERSRQALVVVRLKALAGILGADEMAGLCHSAEERLRNDLGEVLWAAYSGNRPVLWERLEASDPGVTLERTKKRN